jgi:hypothetical protein
MTTGLQWTGVVSSVVGILCGVFFMFFGYRFMKLTLFMGGFVSYGRSENMTQTTVYLLLLLGYITLNILYKASLDGTINLQENALTMLFVATVVAGLIGGILAVTVRKFGLVLVGATGGFFFAMAILSLRNDTLIPNQSYRFVFIALCAIIMAAAVLFFQKHVVIVTTSVGGSVASHLGLATLLGSYFHLAFQVTIVQQEFPPTFRYNLGTQGPIWLASICLTSIIAIIVQYRVTSKRREEGYLRQTSSLT